MTLQEFLSVQNFEKLNIVSTNILDKSRYCVYLTYHLKSEKYYIGYSSNFNLVKNQNYRGSGKYLRSALKNMVGLHFQQ